MEDLKRGQLVVISVEELYNYYGENTPSCTIEYTKEGNTEYFDLYQNYDCVSLDGEEIEFIELNAIGEYWFINKNGFEKNKEFYLTAEEIEHCLFL